jgi:hypothetical protein
MLHWERWCAAHVCSDQPVLQCATALRLRHCRDKRCTAGSHWQCVCPLGAQHCAGSALRAACTGQCAAVSPLCNSVWYSNAALQGATGSVCAALVRSTMQGRRCVLPFTWQGAPRDDCIWRHGMSVCPVAGSTAEAAAAAAGDSSSNPRADSAGDYYGGNPGGNPAGDDAQDGLQDLLVSPTGSSPWAWQQCSRDYETRWEKPPDNAPGRRWVCCTALHACTWLHVLGFAVYIVDALCTGL